MVVPMTFQLRLIDPSDVDFRLDEQTKEVGRRGLARARAALEDARRRPDAEVEDHQSAA
jgi:hypothetical protein